MVEGRLKVVACPFFSHLNRIQMKVKFLKDHLDNKKGETIDVDADRANYWERAGVAEKADKKAASTEKKEASPETSKKEIKTTSPLTKKAK
jgi:hypothetical protein